MTKLAGMLGVLAGGLLILLVAPGLRTMSRWERFAEPGPLSAAHSFLKDDCSSCHVPVRGVDVTRCISCHANETALLQRQPSAFHASIGDCVDCHREHDGDRGLRSGMDHQALARIGLRQLAGAPEGSDAQLLYSHVIVHGPVAAGGPPGEQLLDCFGCHQSRDRHLGQFGRDCAACHGTQQWTIALYRHPPPSSTDCAQCHRPPPSHSMGHFEMVSKRVAGVEHADVEQCYLCHQSTSWNDIRSVGVYFHH